MSDLAVYELQAARKFAEEHPVELARDLIRFETSGINDGLILVKLKNLCKPFAGADALSVSMSLARSAALRKLVQLSEQIEFRTK